MKKTDIKGGQPRRPEDADATFNDLLETLLDRIPERTRSIVRARFGLTGNAPKTLEEIGRTYGITRERIRQIIGAACSSIKQRRDEHSFVEAARRIEGAIEGASGIIRSDVLMDTLADGRPGDRGAVEFFLGCMKTVRELRETEDRARAYILPTIYSEEKWGRYLAHATEAIRDARGPLSTKQLWSKIRKRQDMTEKECFDYLAASETVTRNAFGDWGFAESSEIRPKGTREKAFLVLKKAATPLHFTEIARRIDSAGLLKPGHPTHAQTVHNELIKDKKFVLVGRGLYALAEWGYEPGTVREVIERILRSATRPMKRDEILEAVLRVRTVNRSTVVINLNAHFEKIGKDGYTVAERQ